MGESYICEYQRDGERKYLMNLREALVKQVEPCRPICYIRQTATFPVDNLDHRWMRAQSNGYGRRRDLPVHFSVERLIKMGHEEGLLDGRRYALMTKGDASYVTDGEERRQISNGY